MLLVVVLLSVKWNMQETIERFISIFLFLVVLLFLSGCQKETLITPQNYYNYFPIEDGKWIEYTVDSIYHSENDNNNDDSIFSYHFEIREEIDSSFKDGSGRVNQIIKRYRREDALNPWSLTSVWTQMLSSGIAYRTEENITYHKLSFPINSTVTWNGNDANTFDEEIYYYDSFHEPVVINSLTFDSTISVIQINENNYVQKMYGIEIYAAGVGLIYKVRDELGKRNGVVVKGLEYRMIINAFGNN